MTKRHTIKEVKRRLYAEIDRCGSLRSAATALGISAAYLSDVLADKRAPGKKVLEPIRMVRRGGYGRKLWYEAK